MAIKNSEMKANRVLRLQNGKRRLAAIVNAISAGRTVYATTHLRSVKITAKHVGMVEMDKSGSLWIGKNCIDGCKLTAA